MKTIILASSSIYRQEQLQKLKLPFSTMSPNVDETPSKNNVRDHRLLSRELAVLKARAVSQQHRNAIVIGGDQVASFDGAILSKPETVEKAREQLTALSGKRHQLITSLAIIAEGNEYLHTCTANMNMRELSQEQIKRYIDADSPLLCCGSYRIESLGISLFNSIDCEDHSAITGLPLMWTSRMLSTLGIPVP